MTVQGWIADMKVIDVDSHISEPGDLWTTRLPKKWGDMVPHVAKHPKTGYRTWRIGGMWAHEEGKTSSAGWKEYPPAAPHHLDDEGVDPGVWNPVERLKWMDKHGIHAQVLYPNILAFFARVFMQIDNEISLACVQAWNDYQTEFAKAAPGRYIPIAMLPFWDVQACVKEIHRTYDMGHKGVMFGNRYDRLGLPTLDNTHWDPLYAAVQETDMPVNFHVGLGELDMKKIDEINTNPLPYPIAHTQFVVAEMLANVESIIRITTSGLCQRFPKVKFVSVESGFGYLPYVLESLDWHWKTDNGLAVLPNQLLPSEYFRRQCFGSFWFEKNTLPMLELYPDNFMFETDYPHPTGMSPGPATPALPPNEHIARNLKGVLKEETLRKVLHDNAARIYNLA